MILDSSEILDMVCDFYGLNKKEIFMNTRKRAFVLPRQVFYYFCKKYTKLTFEKIGRIRTYHTTGKPHDHATVLHAEKTVKGFLQVDKSFKKEIVKIKEELKKYHYSTKFKSIVPNQVNLLEICKRNSMAQKNYIAA